MGSGINVYVLYIHIWKVLKKYLTHYKSILTMCIYNILFATHSIEEGRPRLAKYEQSTTHVRMYTQKEQQKTPKVEKAFNMEGCTVKVSTHVQCEQARTLSLTGHLVWLILALHFLSTASSTEPLWSGERCSSNRVNDTLTCTCK